MRATASATRSIYSLNPADSEVRAYVVALCRDLAEQHELTALALETPGWLPYDHGYHHEFALLPLNEWLKVLLGLCFAPATLAAARRAGIDAEPLRRSCATAVESWLAGDHDLDEARARDWLLGDLVADPDWAAFLHWRCRCVAELVAEVRAAVPRSTELWIIPSVQRPSARGWVEGSDLAMLARAADRLELCAYEPSAAAVAADLFDVRRRVGPEARLNAILRPTHPDLAGGADTVAAVEALKLGGVEGIAFYNYGHWRLPVFGPGARCAGGVGRVMRFEGHVALITGGGRGIGRATALRLAREGAAIAVVDRDAEPAQAVAREVGGLALVADIAADDAGPRLVAEAERALGPLDRAGQQRCPRHASRPWPPPSPRTGIPSSRSRCARLG